MNSKFKKLVNHKASDLPNFFKNVEEFVRSDQSVIESAFPGTGEYHLIESLETFNLGSRWWSLSPVRRIAHLNKFLEACKRRTMLGIHVSETQASSKEGPEFSSADDSVPLVPVESQVTLPAVNIASDVLRGILKKSDKLIEDNLVSDIKGQENKQVAIASQSDVFPCIILQDRKRRGKNVVELKCGPRKGCLNFLTHRMLSHTQAAALAWNCLQEYWRFLESSKKVGTSLHSLSRHGLPSGSGKKENQMQ